MSYRDLLVTTISVSSVLAANGAVAGESQQKTEYLRLASIYPLVEVAGDILVSANTQSLAENIADNCVAKGYELGVTCPPADDSTQCVTTRCQPTGVGYDYIKCACYCNGENTCKEMGYTDTSCGAGYTVGDSCFIDPSKVKCVANPCTGYDYTSCPTGYYSTGTCLSGSTTKHACSPNPCTGYATSCSSGYVKNTSDTCLSGTTTKYKCVANPCTGYDLTSACSPADGYTQTTCLSGTTTKYKCVANTCTGYDLTSPCSPASGYTQTTCQAGATTKYRCVAKTCPSDYNLTSPCSPSNGYTQYTCQAGSTTKYKCVANTCSGYYTSCSSGYHLDTAQSCQAGTTTKYKCVADTCAGYDRTSPCSPSNGYTQTTCLSGTTTKYKCVANTCTGYDYTSCPSGYTISASCQAGTTTKYKCSCHADCHSCTDDLDAMSNVLYTTTASGLKTAAAQAGKTVVMMSNIMTSGNIILGAGSKIVGPKYMTSSAQCTALMTPSLMITDNVNNGIKMNSGGTLSDLNIAYMSTLEKSSAIEGYGTLNNLGIMAPTETYGLLVKGGLMNMNGNIAFMMEDSSDGYGDDGHIKIEPFADLTINGNTILTGNPSYGITMMHDSDVRVASSGILGLDGDFFVGIDFDDRNKFIVDGKLIMTGTSSSAVGYIQLSHDVTRAPTLVQFNGSGSVIKASYHGINCNNCDIDINANMTFDMVNNVSGSPTQTAIGLGTTYSGDVLTFDLKDGATITVNGLNSSTDDSIFTVGKTTAKVYGSILSGNSVGRVKFNGYANVTLGGNAKLKSGSYESSYSTVNVYVKNGFNFEIGSACKKATSDRTLSGTQSYITTANSLPSTPFSTTCSGVELPACPFDHYPTMMEAEVNCYVTPYRILRDPDSGCYTCICDSGGPESCMFI